MTEPATKETPDPVECPPLDQLVLANDLLKVIVHLLRVRPHRVRAMLEDLNDDVIGDLPEVPRFREYCLLLRHAAWLDMATDFLEVQPP